MSAISGNARAYAEESPSLARAGGIVGAPWNYEFRGVYPVAPDEIHNHSAIAPDEDAPTEYDTVRGLIASKSARPGYGLTWYNYAALPAPLAIDTFDRGPNHGQAVLSGKASEADVSMPYLDLPGNLPWQYDEGLQIDMASAIGPRQIFRSPPSVSDQTAAIYAAGF